MLRTLRETLLEALQGLTGTREFQLHVLVTSARKDSGLYRYARPRPRVLVQDVLVLVAEEGAAGGGRKFVLGIEAQVYTLPETESGIVYISKVDTTGQGAGPSATRAVVCAFMGYYVDVATRPAGMGRVWVQLFARAQGQYLFANSAEWEGKRALSDVKLCGWWKGVFEEVARRDGSARLYYVLPGYGEGEAVQMLPAGGRWEYGHPSVTNGENLAHVIPSFEDDPKARFLDELAGGGAGKRKRGELERVGPGEFWERMSFRQECVAGAVTGFFALGVAGAALGAAQTDEAVPVQVHRRIRTLLTTKVEFSSVERSVRGTEIVESAIRGLCGDAVSARASVDRPSAPPLSAAGAVTVLSARRKRDPKK
ncbi:hypothetical protein C0992_012573 [Termitomyces sp. T32_za158]|nr:hypothetical protein C0992_012573 [Termitomyces sp. T32_za158]